MLVGANGRNRPRRSHRLYLASESRRRSRRDRQPCPASESRGQRLYLVSKSRNLADPNIFRVAKDPGQERRRLKVDFREADLQYTDLKQRHTNGILTDDEFDAQLKHIMVQDSEGRWWAKHRETGEWHYDDDGVWRPGTPPDPDYRRGTATGEPTTHTPPEEPEVRRQQPRQGSRTATAEINWGQIAWPVFLSGIIPSLLNFFLPGNLFGVFVVGSLTYSGAFLLFHL